MKGLLPLSSQGKKMFKITHGKNKGEKACTEDEALALLTTEDLAQGGYVHIGSKAFLEGGQYQEPTISGAGFGFNPISAEGFASMINRVRKGS